MSTYHIPVLTREIIDGLRVRENGVYIDATVGGGGHTEAIVQAGGRVLGIDRDTEAIDEVSFRLKDEIQNGSVKLIQGNYRNIGTLARSVGINKCDGVLFDLGVSSHQLDTETRGFAAKQRNALLDGRFDQSAGRSIRDCINTESGDTLYEIFARFGEEKHSRAISHAITSARRIKPIDTADDLARCVRSVISDEDSIGRTMARTLQALRIYVNDELGALTDGLNETEMILKPGGRVAVISYHSLEDRIVKLFMRNSDVLESIMPKPIVPGEPEIRKNPRARSAKLRIAHRVR